MLFTDYFKKLGKAVFSSIKNDAEAVAKRKFKVVVDGYDMDDAQGLFAIRVTKYLLLPMCEIFISPPAA